MSTEKQKNELQAITGQDPHHAENKKILSLSIIYLTNTLRGYSTAAISHTRP